MKNWISKIQAIPRQHWKKQFSEWQYESISEHFKKMYLEERLKLAYKDTEPPFLLLSDYHYAVVKDDGKGLEIINTKA